MKNKVNLQLVSQLVSGVTSMVDHQVNEFKKDWIRTRLEDVVLPEELILQVKRGNEIKEEEYILADKIENSFFTGKIKETAEKLRTERNKIDGEIRKLEFEYEVRDLVGYWQTNDYLDQWKKALATVKYNRLYKENEGVYRIVEAEFKMQFLNTSEFPATEEIQKRFTELKYPNYEVQL